MKQNLHFWFFIIGIVSLIIYIICTIIYIVYADKFIPLLILSFFSLLRARLEFIENKIDQLNKK